MNICIRNTAPGRLEQLPFNGATAAAARFSSVAHCCSTGGHESQRLGRTLLANVWENIHGITSFKPTPLQHKRTQKNEKAPQRPQRGRQKAKKTAMKEADVPQAGQGQRCWTRPRPRPIQFSSVQFCLKCQFVTKFSQDTTPSGEQKPPFNRQTPRADPDSTSTVNRGPVHF